MKKLKLLKKADIIIFVVLLVSCLLLLFILSKGTLDTTAYIYKDTKVVKEINLQSVQKPYDIKYSSGNHSLTVHIEKGKICFSEADCPDKICVNTGYLSKNGDTAVCVPSKMMIVVKSSNSNRYMTY